MFNPWRSIGLLVVALIGFHPTQSTAEPAGLITRASHYSVRVTLDRFASAVRSIGWVMFTEIDHSAAAGRVGLTLAPRVVALFGNPRGGTPAMASHPTLAIDLPMRVLVWADDAGTVFVTRNSGSDIAARVFARHGIAVSEAGQQETDQIIATLVRQASE